MHADAAAPGQRPAAAPPARARPRGGRGRTCCRSRNTERGRPRPDRQHAAAAQRERLTIILAELGTGLAGRGRDLDAVSAAPTRAAGDRQGAAPPGAAEPDARAAGARLRHRSSPRWRASAGTSPSSPPLELGRPGHRRAARGARGRLQRFPRFLDELQPTMRASARWPTDDARGHRPGAQRGRHQPSSRSSARSREAGHAGARGARRRVGARHPRDPRPIPIVKDLRSLAKTAKPVAATLAEVLTSFQREQGLQRLLDYVYYQATAVNGFDSVGHYLRARAARQHLLDVLDRPGRGLHGRFPPEPRPASAASAAGSDGRAAHRRRAPRRGSRPWRRGRS